MPETNGMPRAARVSAGTVCDHVLIRGNAQRERGTGHRPTAIVCFDPESGRIWRATTRP